MVEIIYKGESYRIIGSCMKVHSELGPGFLESVYQEALAIQFEEDRVPFQREVLLNVYYQGKPLKKKFKADFVCFDKIIVELKSASYIHNDNISQANNYLKSINFQLGILVNFGEKSLNYKRIINKRTM
ncbi:MAG: GxxExxY protein [Porphyromonadaceae bacterium]|jgi:GxxExxY protein|nr:GxxExxY protein [Porphyromonadaceae bacterium]